MAVLEHDNQLLVLTFQITTDLTAVDFCEQRSNFLLVQLSENRKLMFTIMPILHWTHFFT